MVQINEQQWNLLWERKQNHRLPHALLLTGSAGLGKLEFAKQFSEACLCENVSVEGVPCKVCHSCSCFNAGTHPDFFLIQPEEEAKLIKIDQIRALIGSLSQTSHSGKFKIVIIEPAEAMNIASSNALLKTLEEPTDNTLILLVTHQVSLLPATVRSRCQKITFNDTESLGMEDSKFPPPVLGGRARVGGTVEPDQEKFIHDLIQVLSKKLDPIMMASQYIKVEMENWLQWLIIFVINIIHSKMNLSASIYELDLKKLNLAQLFFYLDKLYLAHRNQQLHMNPNKQLLLETLLSSLEATYDC